MVMVQGSAGVMELFFAGASDLAAACLPGVIMGASLYFFAAVLIAWPPNWFLIAASSLSEYESESRDVSLFNNDSVITGAGTSRSIASETVQRPSPESETYGAMPAISGFSFNAILSRSSSQDRTTLPVRQISDTWCMSSANSFFFFR